MAARRLLIVMLILLGISSVLAIALPKPDRSDPPPEQSAATGATGATAATGTDQSDGTASGESGIADEEASEEAAGAKAEAGSARYESIRLETEKPVEIDARPGSRMVLTVKSQKGSVVEIEGLGLTGYADPYAPEVFDLILPPDPGTYRVSAPGEKPSAVIDTGS